MSNSVLQLCSYDAPYPGNFIRSLRDLERKIEANGGRMIYVFENGTVKRAWAQQLLEEGKSIYFLPTQNSVKIQFFYRLVQKYNIKYIHTHFAGVQYFGLFSLLRVFIARRLLIVAHLHSMYPKQTFLVRLAKKVLTSVDYYIACSKDAADHYQKINRISDSKIGFVQNAIDFSRLDRFENLDRSKFAIGSDTKCVLLFGYNYYVKGVDIALRAVSDLIEDKHDVCLILSLSINSSFVFRKIREQFGSIPDWIKVVEPRDDVATLYKFCDVFISPSRSEGFCYSLVEAAYCGVPIIASDIPGQNSLGIPHTYKFLSENVNELKSQLLKIFSMKSEELDKQVKFAKAYVQSNFELQGWSQGILEKYLALYTTLS